MTLAKELQNHQSSIDWFIGQAPVWYQEFGRHAILVEETEDGELAYIILTLEMVAEMGDVGLIERVERYNPEYEFVIFGAKSQRYATLSMLSSAEHKPEPAPVKLEPGWLRKVMTEKKGG